jgi:transglutaminase-like putative cysteine protease
MNLAKTFKLSLYLLTALAGWILGAAEEGWIPYGSLLAALIGYLWTEGSSRQRPCRDDAPAAIRNSAGRQGERGLSDSFASVSGFFAMVTATMEFFSDNVEGRLLSGIHLVVYLTWIVLLQRKTDRRYWLLLALGCLQLAVASVLTGGPSTIWFGACAIIYIFAATWTMSVFSLYRSASEFEPVKGESGDRPAHLNMRQSEALDSVQIENGVTWISSPFITGVIFTCATGLFVSALFFALIPRVWIPATGSLTGDNASGRSPFATEVKLGDIGPILERMDPVLRLRLFSADHSPITPQSYADRLGLPEPLFRGSVLTTYDSPAWKADPNANQRPMRLTPFAINSMVRQEIRMEDIGTDTLLCLGSPRGLTDSDNQPRGSHQWVTDLLHRSPDLRPRGAVKYTVYSEIPPPGRPPGTVVFNDMTVKQLAQRGYLEPDKVFPPRLERLSQLAHDIVAKEGKRRGVRLSQLEIARALESHLRDSGEYAYSLQLAVQDSSIDPVEDFLFNRKQGHCEYFASALVLMLRSVDIPARLISGYKGGDYEESSQTLVVQQRHAHAWCEAWINNNSWVTLDATPVDERAASVDSVSANRSLWSNLKSQLSGIWSENVVNISLDKQEEVIYRPIRELIRSFGQALKELWNSPGASLASYLALLVNPRHWFSLRGAGVLFVTVATLWLMLRIIRRLRSDWSERHPKVTLIEQRRVEFYERFVRLMQACDLQRDEAQTQQEFASVAESTLRLSLQPAGVAAGPAEISDLFYRVRFGDEVLPDSVATRIDEVLRTMEQALEQLAHSKGPSARK